jgi:hypothetical protein
MDVDVVIKRNLTYMRLFVATVDTRYLVVIWAEQIALTHQPHVFLFTFALLMVVGFLFPKLRFRTEEALERALFRKRIDYRETLLRSSRDMVSIVELKALSENLVRTVGKSLEIGKVSLLLHNDVNGKFQLQASVGLDLDQPETIFVSKDGPLVQLLQSRREPIVKEELEWVPLGPGTPQTVEAMAKLGAELSLPIISKSKLIGILNLGYKETNYLPNEDPE